mmetsp:Transcript_123678/g.345006  ORF Transcript_123678/g.345006 Transcript_123678/m.345006 type:complete len:224 (-) Transcript_123678:344-1015(-)
MDERDEVQDGAAVEQGEISSRRLRGCGSHASTAQMSSALCPAVSSFHRLMASSTILLAASMACEGMWPCTKSAASCGAMTSQTPSLAMSSATSCGPTSRTSTGGSSETPTACTEASPRLRDMLSPELQPWRNTRWQRPSKTTRPPHSSMRAFSAASSGTWSCVRRFATRPPSSVRRSSTAPLSPTWETTRRLRSTSCTTTVAVVPESRVPSCALSHSARCTRA